MSLDDFPFWTAVFAPIGLIVQKIHNYAHRISTLEANQKNNLDKLDKIDDLCQDVAYIKGKIDEHFKNSNF